MLRIYTLGPAGSCHENALNAYLAFQGVCDAEIVFVDDLVAAGEEVANSGDAYLLQCSAHLNVHLVTERYRDRLQVVDTFIYPTQPIAVVKRRGLANPRTLGLPQPTLGYINEDEWDELVFETTKPVVEQKLLDGSYDAGVAYVASVERHPNKLELIQEIGQVVTTWLLYGCQPRFDGKIIANPFPPFQLERSSA